MTPALRAVASPQLMVALKSLRVALGFASVNSTRVPLNATFWSAAMSCWAVMASDASSTDAVVVPVAEVPSASVIATVIVNEPSSTYVWVPLTAKPGCNVVVTTPALMVVLSPQLMVAVNEDAFPFASSSWKVTSDSLKTAPSVALTATAVGVIGASPFTVVVTVALLLVRFGSAVAALTLTV